MDRIERDRNELAGRLRRVPAAGRILFAAACSERLLRGLEASASKASPADMRKVLDAVWGCIGDYAFLDRKQELRTMLEAYDEGIANDLELPEDASVAWEVAEFAAAAVLETLSCAISHEAHQAANAASSVWNAVATHIANLERVDPNSWSFERRVYDNGLMRTELDEEEQDLQFASTQSELSKEDVDVIRSRARQNSLPFFGL